MLIHFSIKMGLPSQLKSSNQTGEVYLQTEEC
jgi:hypothetical protein